jgi:8-oxo-dGTP diphosphatase
MPVDLPYVIEVVAALIRRGNEVLVVQQQGPDDPEPGWSLPGGRVHAGELLHEALAREVAEETGLVVSGVGGLVYAVHVDDPQSGRHVVGFAFEADVEEGALLPADPDELILEARWAPIAEAVDLLRPVRLPSMVEPMAAHVSGVVEQGAVWFYRSQADGTERLVTRLPA